MGLVEHTAPPPIAPPTPARRSIISLCGVCPDDLPEQMQAYCGRMTESPQG